MLLDIVSEDSLGWQFVKYFFLWNLYALCQVGLCINQGYVGSGFPVSPSQSFLYSESKTCYQTLVIAKHAYSVIYQGYWNAMEIIDIDCYFFTFTSSSKSPTKYKKWMRARVNMMQKKTERNKMFLCLLVNIFFLLRKRLRILNVDQ